jgi:hypothetical protein
MIHDILDILGSWLLVTLIIVVTLLGALYLAGWVL